LFETPKKFDWRYAEAPDIPELVYIGASVYLVGIGLFGIVANGGVLIGFVTGLSEVQTTFNFHQLIGFVTELREVQTTFNTYKPLIGSNPKDEFRGHRSVRTF
jgi:hypothetical protein